MIKGFDYEIAGYTKPFRGERAARMVTRSLLTSILKRGAASIPQVNVLYEVLRELREVEAHELDHAFADVSLNPSRLGQISLGVKASWFETEDWMRVSGSGSYVPIGERSPGEIKAISMAPANPSECDIFTARKAGRGIEFAPFPLEKAQARFEIGIQDNFEAGILEIYEES